MNWLVDLIDYGVVGVLLILSIVVVALSIERFLFYFVSKKSNIVLLHGGD